MKNTEPFVIFGSDHILAILSILTVSLLVPWLIKNKTRDDLYVFTTSLATVMIVNEFGKAFYYPYLYPDQYEFFEMLPFHMCHLSSFTTVSYTHLTLPTKRIV